MTALDRATRGGHEPPARAVMIATKNLEAAHRELAVVLACHRLICALPVRAVERLLLREAVSLHAPPSRRPRDIQRSLPQVVYAAGEPYAAWNLGTLLGLPPVSVAWVLLRVGSGAETVPIALRTGTCLIVQPMPESAPLPPALFLERGAGFAGAFSTAQLRDKRIAPAMGLCLDPERLWSEQELADSRAAVAAASEGREDSRP